MAKRTKKSQPPAQPLTRQVWGRRLLRNVLLWLVPVSLLWVLITPSYNLFLTGATENLVRLFESPSVTRLQVSKTHYFKIDRTDVPQVRGSMGSVRVSDTHFPLIMLATLFLAVPGVSWRQRGEALLWALVISAFFHIILLCFWVQFHYATQNGEWSAANYSPFEQNFWGLGKHLLAMPFKLSLPLVLWAAFFLREMPRTPRSAAAAR